MIGQAWANTQYFNPRNPGGLVLWLDATDPAANGVQPANGSSVSAWVDKSGRANSGAQATGANQPVFNTNQLNGKPGVTFVSNTKYMSLGTSGFPTGSAGRTVFLVAKLTSVNAANYFFAGEDGVANHSFSMETTNAFTGNNFTFLDGGGTYAGGTTTIVSAGTSYLIELNYPAAAAMVNTSIIVNGVTQTIGQSNGAGLATNYATNYLASLNPPPLAGINGNINELIIYNSSLTAAKQTLVRSYLKNKWGI